MVWECVVFSCVSVVPVLVLVHAVTLVTGYTSCVASICLTLSKVLFSAEIDIGLATKKSCSCSCHINTQCSNSNGNMINVIFQ